MKKVSLTNIRIPSRWAMAAGLGALGFVAVIAGQSATGGFKSTVTDPQTNSSQSQASESPAATAKPDITVNGTKIPTDKNGSSSVDIPGGKAQVNVSGDQTRVTTSSDGKNGDTSNKTSTNVNLNISSQSSGGTNSGSTNAFGFTNSFDGTTWSSSSTSVNSSGSSDVNISQ